MVGQSQAGGMTQANRVGRLVTELGADALVLTEMEAEDRLSQAFTVTVSAVSATAQPLHKLLGTRASVRIATGQLFQDRWFSGVVWSYEELGRDTRGFAYRLTLRPETELLTLNRRSRIFQNKSVVDIAKLLLANCTVEQKLSGTYSAYEYCVQYGESDWQFLNRLLEHEGIYFFYVQGEGSDRIVLVDDRNNHLDLQPASVPVRQGPDKAPGPCAWGLSERRTLGPSKVTVDDYDFEAPATSLRKTKAAAKVLGSPTASSGASGEGKAGGWSGDAEIYAFPAKFDSKGTAAGERYGAAWLDAHRRRMARSHADVRLFAATVGRRVTLEFDGGASTEYLILGATHRYTNAGYFSGSGGDELAGGVELMPAAEQYRPAHATPRPRIPGPHTALVVGPPGEEIHTDKYGRIKVQFPWDREGKKDANSSCFIRVAQSAAGQNWGFFALPRIGQEVVVEFLDGDPDRPLVTGTVYNAKNMVPETLPDNKTQFGMKSRISKGGGGFNRLWFEDKKGSEVVWFRAERDYKVNIVNKDEERVYDKGSRTTTFKAGDETLTLSQGKRTTTIQADETLEVKQGNRAATIKLGNDTLKVNTGNVDIKVSLGSHKTDAMQSIELTCGASKIKLDPTSITLDSVMIKINGKAMTEIKAPLIQSDASALQIVKGGLVMIN